MLNYYKCIVSGFTETQKVIKKYYKSKENYKLENLSIELEINTENARSAAQDVENLCEIIKKIGIPENSLFDFGKDWEQLFNKKK